MLIFITFFFYHTFHVPFVPSLHRSQRFLFGEKNQNFILEFSVVIVLLPLLNCCSLPLNLYRGNKRYPSEFWFQRVLHTPIMQQQPNSSFVIKIQCLNRHCTPFSSCWVGAMKKTDSEPNLVESLHCLLVKAFIFCCCCC